MNKESLNQNEAEIIRLSESERALLDLFNNEGVQNISKAWLLLAIAGIKPVSSASFPFSYEKEGATIPNGMEEKLPLIQEALVDAGLSSKIEILSEGGGGAEVRIAKNEILLDEIEALDHQAISKEERHKLFGQMVGYPETAAAAYAHDRVRNITSEDSDSQMLPHNEYPTEDFMAFCSFGLSKENWEEELELVKKWAETVKKIDPELYRQVVADYHG